MVSQEELEFAIARFKARESGREFAEVVPTAPTGAVAMAEDEELSADAYQVEDELEDVDAYAQPDEDTASAYGGAADPDHVQSMSDSSLIELGDDAYDPERNN